MKRVNGKQKYENFLCYMGFLCAFADTRGFLVFFKLVINLKFLFTQLLSFDCFCDGNRLLSETAVMHHLTMGIHSEKFIGRFHCAKRHRVY